MREAGRRLVTWYARKVANHPFIVILFALVLTGISISFFSAISVDNPDIDELLPDDNRVVQSLDKLSDELGGGSSSAFTVVVELDPSAVAAPEDIRTPEIARYTYSLAQQIEEVEEVTGVSSMGQTLIDFNDNRLPTELQENQRIIEQHPRLFERIVNDDYSLTVLRVNAEEGFDVSGMVEEVEDILTYTREPAGVTTFIAGEQVAAQIAQSKTGEDSQKTSTISLLAITALLIFTFRSPVYSFLPLTTIIFGVLWTFGFMGAAGLPLSNFSSGAISMIIGIGIDFGIQIMMRFRYELGSAEPVEAMTHTMENVILPMTTTTVAAFIGFQAMTLGKFAVLGEFGEIMSFGVTFSFLAAITVVPSVLVLYERYKPKNLNSPKVVLRRALLLIRGKTNN